MWKVQTKNLSEGVINVTATFTNLTTNFTWDSIIKTGEEVDFVNKAKGELLKHNELHKDDITTESSIALLLNEIK